MASMKEDITLRQEIAYTAGYKLQQFKKKRLLAYVVILPRK